MLWRRLRRGRDRSAIDSGRALPAELFDPLEARQLLFAGPMLSDFPPLSALEAPGNSVVRLHTNMGRIDVELFDNRPAATLAIQNFRQYVLTGRYDEMFFHQADSTRLFAGRYRWDGSATTTLGAFTPLPNQFTSANIARTLSFAPVTFTTSTTQFIVNLADNPGLNVQDGGWAVFGRVIQGWEVVQSIAGLTRHDLNNQLNPSNPGAGLFSSVPTRPTYTFPAVPGEMDLVRIADVEFTKVPGETLFYSRAAYFPEALRTAGAVESLDLVNATVGADARAVHVQVIVRYSSGERDSVVYLASMAANSRFRLQLSNSATPSNNLIRANVPYSIEVRSTGAVGAAMSRRLDGSGHEGESFFNPTSSTINANPLRTWHFPAARKDARELTGVHVIALSGGMTTVNVQVYPEGTAIPITASLTLKPFHRGTINVHPLVTGLPEGTRYSVRVVSTGAPIVASIARQRLSGGGGTISDASSEIGTMGAGRHRGYLPAARFLAGSEAHIEFFYANPGVAFTNISVQFIRSNGQVINSSANLTNLNRRARIDLTQVAGLWANEFFSIRYVATGNANVSAVYTAEIGGDRMSTPFVTASSRNVHLADGNFNPTLTFPNDIEEFFSVFNPFQQPGQNLRYNLLFRFSDNTQIQAFTSAQPLGPLGRADWRAADFPAVLTKLQNQPAARFFSVIVVSEADFATTGSMIAAQTTRIWWNLGLSTTTIASKSPDEPVFFANDPLFN